MVSILSIGCFCASAAEAPVSPGQPPKAEETNALENLRSYVQLQEQLHATQLAIEQVRKDNSDAAARSLQLLTERLQGIEGALSTQRARELEAMQSSNRVMLTVAGTFAFIGVVAMLLMAFFQWRTVHGLAAISAGLPQLRSLGPGSAIAALTNGDAPAAMPGQVKGSNARLVWSLEQLERRLYGLEQASRPALHPGTSGDPGITETQLANGAAASAAAAAARPVTATSGDTRVKQLLAAGQALLDQDKPEPALGLFDEALALSPRNGEALVNKGTALERLQRVDEAIACYDEAIAANSSLTIAYLHKGGLFNRLEKFGEALECYEKALRTQEKRTS